LVSRPYQKSLHLLHLSHLLHLLHLLRAGFGV
jgi:hypothetical protein